MWKLVKSPSIISDLFEVSDSGDIRWADTKEKKFTYISQEGYVIVPYVRKNSIQKLFKLHRLIAATFIGDIDGMEVHHIDGNRSNNNVSNLMICSRETHRRAHATTDKPIQYEKSKNKYVLSSTDVENICELLSKGMSYPKIRETLNLYNISDGCIGKIYLGKIWTDISKKYGFPKNDRKRDTMNTYSENAFMIGLLMSLGVSVKKIGAIYNYDTSSNKSYQRLFKAATRYKQQFLDGKWGYYTENEINHILKKENILDCIV